jgi:chromate reductase, NAD(P)H dehydrogenase (quinone)
LSDSIRVLLITGSTRHGSANTAALTTAAELAPSGITPVLYGGLAGLPAFNPDHDGDLLPPAAAELRGEIAAAAAVLFCTPEYAGTLPGSFKNLLDWTVGGGEMYEKPVTWLNVANPGRGGGAAATLALVLSYVGATVIDSACRDIPVPRTAITPEGTVSDPLFASAVADVWTALLTQLGDTS